MFIWDSAARPAVTGRLRRNLVVELLERRDCPALPMASSDAFAVSAEGVIDATAPGILANDHDDDSDPLSVALESCPNHGSLDLFADGSFVYTAADPYVGDDSFTYRTTAGGEASDVALVQLHIALAAIAGGPLQADVGEEFSEVLASVLVADASASPTTFQATIAWGDGTYSAGQISAASSGLSVSGDHTYVNAGSYLAEVTVTDPGGSTSTAYVTIDVSAAAPIANADSFAVSQDGVITVAAPGVLANDFDANLNPLSASLETAPGHGSVAMYPDGSFVYTAVDQYVGDDSFSYRAMAGGLSSDVCVVQVHIALAAVVASESLQVDVGEEFSGILASVLVADTGADPAAFAATIDWGDQTTSEGQISLVSPGVLAVSGVHTYADNGSYAAQVTVTSPGGSTSKAYPTINVANVAPALTLTIAYGFQRTVTLSGHVTDDQPSGLTVSFTGQVTGTVTTATDGTFSLTTDALALGTIQATVTDDDGSSSEAAEVIVTSNAPVIVGFQATRTDDCWHFQGSVNDESAEGLLVTFGGDDLPTLAEQQTTIAADGTFSLILPLPAGENGLASARVTDWWGMASAIVTVLVCPS